MLSPGDNNERQVMVMRDLAAAVCKMCDLAMAICKQVTVMHDLADVVRDKVTKMAA